MFAPQLWGGLGGYGSGGLGGGAAGGAAGGGAVAGGGGLLGGGGSKVAAWLAGSQFLTSYLQDRSNRRASKEQREFVKQQIAAALAELSPEQIQSLTEQYFPQIMQTQSALGQTAIGGLRESAARAGLGETPFALSSEAGLRAQLANYASTEAFRQAMQTAGQRANIAAGGVQGANFFQPSNLGSNLQSAFDTFILAKALGGQNRQQPQRQAAPFVLPNTNTAPYSGRNYSFGQNYGRPFLTGY